MTDAQGMHVLWLLARTFIGHGLRSIRQGHVHIYIRHIYIYTHAYLHRYMCTQGRGLTPSQPLCATSAQHFATKVAEALLHTSACPMLCRCFNASASHREQHMLNALRLKSLMRCCTQEKITHIARGQSIKFPFPCAKCYVAASLRQPVIVGSTWQKPCNKLNKAWTKRA